MCAVSVSGFFSHFVTAKNIEWLLLVFVIYVFPVVFTRCSILDGRRWLKDDVRDDVSIIGWSNAIACLVQCKQEMINIRRNHVREG